MNCKKAMWILCAVAVALSGCVSTDKEYPAKRQYVIDVTHPGKVAGAPPNAASLKVRRFRVSDRFDTTMLVTRTGAVTYQTDFYNEFLAGPGALVADEARQWLDASGLFANVASSTSRAQARYLLEGNIVTLCGDYRDSDKPVSVLEVQIFLIDTSTGDNVVAFNKTYRQETPATAAGPPALVESINAGLLKIFMTLEADLRRKKL
jgi:cholesterol transport system auxiliary component